MTDFDGAAFGREVTGVVLKYVDKQLSPLVKRLDAVDTMLVEFGKQFETIAASLKSFNDTLAKIDSDTNTLAKEHADGQLAIAELVKNIEAIEVPMLPDIPALVLESVDAAIIERTPGLEASVCRALAGDMGLSIIINNAVAAAVKALPVPVDGKSVTVDDVTPLIEQLIAENDAKHFTTLTEYSKSIDARVNEVLEMVPSAIIDMDEKIKTAIDAIPTPKDGVDGKDGASVSIAEVLAEIGPAVDEAIAGIEAQKAAIADVVAAIPTPKDGEDGKSVTLEDVMPALQGMVDSIREEVKSIETELTSTVQEAIAAIPEVKNGEDGKSITLAEVMPELMTAVEAQQEVIAAELTALSEGLVKTVTDAIALIPEVKDGTSVTLEDVRPILDQSAKDIQSSLDSWANELGGQLRQQVMDAVLAIPEVKDGKDGASVTLEDVLPVINKGIEDLAEAMTEDVKRIEEATAQNIEIKLGEFIASVPTPKDGVDGKSVDPHEVQIMVAKEVSEQFVARAPDLRGERGPAVDTDVIKTLLDGMVAEAIAELPVPVDGKDGKDGVGLAGALIDRKGELVVTLTNGEAKALGPVVGKDIDEHATAKMISDLVVKTFNDYPKPKDGKDGITPDLVNFELDQNTKELVVSVKVGEEVTETRHFIPMVVDRGVYSEKYGEYLTGDGATFGGSFWIAQKKTSSKPGDNNADWRLAVKRGRDGKDGKIPTGPVNNVPLNGG